MNEAISRDIFSDTKSRASKFLSTLSILGNGIPNVSSGKEINCQMKLDTDPSHLFQVLIFISPSLELEEVSLSHGNSDLISTVNT